jgi:hypothetical protein
VKYVKGERFAQQATKKSGEAVTAAKGAKVAILRWEKTHQR